MNSANAWRATRRARIRPTLGLVACLALGLGCTQAEASTPAKQIEADWLRQAEAWRANPPGSSGALGSVSTRDDATGAVDGIKNGKYAFHTGHEPNPWWQVDLGEPVSIARIVVYNRLDYAPGLHNADNLILLVSDDGQNWTQQYDNQGKHFGGISILTNPFSVDGSGQRVRNLLDGVLGPGHVHGMDLWWDADRVVFGYAASKTGKPVCQWPPGFCQVRLMAHQLRETEEPTHIFEIGIDGTNLRQLTDHEYWSGMDETGYALYLIDVFGNKEMIYRDPEISSVVPIPLRPRKKPPILPDLTDPGQDWATCVVNDIAYGVNGIAPERIRYLRISEGVPWPYERDAGGRRYESVAITGPIARCSPRTSSPTPISSIRPKSSPSPWRSDPTRASLCACFAKERAQNASS
ncbi:MAG: discoidin domain-containing protein [Planctomycetota bacterium]